MKKNFLYIITGLLMVTGLVGCGDDFLTEKSETSFTASTLFTTPDGIDKMTFALYAYERSFLNTGVNSIPAAFIYSERITDLVVFLTGDDARISRYTNAGPSSDVGDLLYSPFWSHRYYMIGRTNEIIYYGDKLGDEAKESVAEGRFWRAYNYYGLWSRFSKVYLSTEPVTKDNLESLTYTPADSVAVFKLMYEDLDKAIENLPEVPVVKERISKSTARHMKALVAAWARDWPEVAKQVDEIDKDPAHGFIPSPFNIFNGPDLFNSETLLALNFMQGRGGSLDNATGGHRLGSQYSNKMFQETYTFKVVNNVVQQYNIENLGNNWGLAFPNSYLMSLYPKNDLRLSAYYKRYFTYQNPNSLITVPAAKDVTVNGVTLRSTMNETGSPRTVAIGDTIYGRDIVAAKKPKLNRRALLPASLKMVDIWTKPLDADGKNSFRDVLIYRISESYLLGAEAYYQLGNQEKARYYYNKTWERGGNPKETGEITFDMIRDENARELAFEGRRFEFLKRNGIWYSQMRSYAGDFTRYPSSTFTLFDKNAYGVSDGRDPKFGPNPNYYYDFNGSDNDAMVRFNVKPAYVNWPIPQDQIDAMGAANFPQNSGY
ncbi:MAG: RagB/SusD family nutrient uptake outer membrane protein [Paludibacteraceae bacterium]